ncbi:hypothetical protein T484DRAFT_1880820 [Baffinella frigidus]|nr:hypothetical protein T484DRAFT_1880820 [Cryptophyta sp. CCMP2293]
MGKLRRTLILLAAALHTTSAFQFLPASASRRHGGAFNGGGADVWRGRRSRSVCAWRAALDEKFSLIENGEAGSGSKRLRLKKSFKKASAGLVQWWGDRTEKIRRAVGVRGEPVEATELASASEAAPTGAWHESLPKFGKIRTSALQLVGSATGTVWMRAVANEAESKRQQEELDATHVDEHMHQLHEQAMARRREVVMQGYLPSKASTSADPNASIPRRALRPSLTRALANRGSKTRQLTVPTRPQAQAAAAGGRGQDALVARVLSEWALHRPSLRERKPRYLSGDLGAEFGEFEI